MIFTPPIIIFFFLHLLKEKLPLIQPYNNNKYRGKGNAEKKRRKMGVSLYCRVVKAARMVIFVNVALITFEINFYAEIYFNDIFLFFLNYF